MLALTVLIGTVHGRDARRQWWYTLAIMLALLIGVTQPGSAQTPMASGNADSAAGFLVDTGEGEPIYAVVTFERTTMSAIDLVRRSGIPAVTVDIGGMGKAMCSIVTTGCDVSECRQRLCQTGDPESPFWQFWRQSDDGSWTMAQLGASHSEIGNGDIDAWIWTGTDPSLPELDWSELATRAGAPDEVVEGEIHGEPAVYVSGLPDDDEGRQPMQQAFVAIGLVIALGGFGSWLILRQRKSARGEP